jgi:hypothetical protein
MRILHLTLKKKWFDLIKSGDKKLEYREDKPYWQKRLLHGDDTPRAFDIVRFKNGYAKDSPTMDVEFKGITFSGLKWLEPTRHGEILPEKVLVIRLGKVICCK